MSGKRERGVAKSERGHTTPRALDWESARIFLEVSRQKSLRAASAVLGQSVNALRRRLDELERSLDAKLLTRHVDGVRLTAEGQRMLAAATQMETASFNFLRAAGDEMDAGEVRLAVTEGLGTFWVAPRIGEFGRRHPNIRVELICSMSPADVLRLEADLAVQISAPQAKDLRRVKLGRLHMMPFASRSYIETNGAPKSLEDVARHRLLIQMSPQLTSEKEFEQMFNGAPPVDAVALTTNVSTAHFFSLASGAGIGVLPTYSALLEPPVVPVDLGYTFHQDIWLIYHADVGRIERVRNMIDWLIAAFSPKKYPWFADAFVHPKDFPKP